MGVITPTPKRELWKKEGERDFKKMDSTSPSGKLNRENGRTALTVQLRFGEKEKSGIELTGVAADKHRNGLLRHFNNQKDPAKKVVKQKGWEKERNITPCQKKEGKSGREGGGGREDKAGKP